MVNICSGSLENELSVLTGTKEENEDVIRLTRNKTFKYG